MFKLERDFVEHHKSLVVSFLHDALFSRTAHNLLVCT